MEWTTNGKKKNSLMTVFQIYTHIFNWIHSIQKLLLFWLQLSDTYKDKNKKKKSNSGCGFFKSHNFSDSGCFLGLG